jgi:AraC family transcriptional regulator of adaptative response/methylated-DNA-[protein]-cysteine methyltransferase
MASMSTPLAFLESRHFDRIARAIAFIDVHWREQPALERMARHVGLSRYHFERLFSRWAGLSPKQYLQFVTGAAAKAGLSRRQSVLDTALATGLSGPGRLHDLIVKLEAVSPAEYASGGAGVVIDYGVTASPFGSMLAGRTVRGICYLGFMRDSTRARATALLRADWPQAMLRWSPVAAGELAASLWPDSASGLAAGHRKICLHVRGTNFQLRVWRALLELETGQHASYGSIAARLEQPGAARAVGGAVGANPVAWLIPCHRVLRAGGALGGYRSGTDRKRAMLAWESVQAARPASPVTASP